MTDSLFLWWLFLCAVAGLNILAWSLSAAALERRQAALSPEAYSARRMQLLLSAGYVFGCAFRSVFPVFDVPRVCLFDSWLCTVVVGRTIATVAELCFVAQLALMLREISRDARSVTGRLVSAAVVPLIVIAEVCSWYSVLTTSNLGHVFEESLWGVSAALIVASALAIWPRSDTALRRLLAAACTFGIVYVAYIFTVDVPMYWSRWLADEANGRAYLSAAQGLFDISSHLVVSHRWEVWRNEIAWMSLYFSVAVWFSIALIHAPARARRTGRRKRRPISLARPPLRAAN